MNLTLQRGLDLDPRLLDAFVEAADDLGRALAEAPDESLRSGVVRIVVLDWDLPGVTGAGAIRALLDAATGTKVVILDEDRGLDEVVDAMKTVRPGEVSAPEPRLSVANRPAGRGAPPTNLTRRELEILGLLAEGYSNAALAQRLSITANTVRNHVQRILEKLGAHSKLEAVTTSLRTGVVKIRAGL